METQTNEKPVGGSYLKDGMLRGGVKVTVPIDNRRANKQATENGPFAKLSDFGSLNLEIPVTISDVPYVVSIPEKSHDAQELLTRFGKSLPEWVGKNVVIQDDAFLTKIRIAPA